MIRRLALGGVAAALALVTAPAAFAATCPQGFKAQPTGLYNPTTGNPIYACMPYPGPR